jgi:hypothetical protein
MRFEWCLNGRDWRCLERVWGEMALLEKVRGGMRAWLQGLCKVGAGGMTCGSGLLRVVSFDRGDQCGSNGV